MTTVETIEARPRRGTELLLLFFALAIVLLAWVDTEIANRGAVPAGLATIGGGLLAVVLLMHLVVRWKAPYADPLLLPIATLLNGLGLVMIHRLDLAAGNFGFEGDAFRQLIWTGISVTVAAGVLWLLRDHRTLRRYTYTAMAAGVLLLVLPLMPVIGNEQYGSRIWIRLGPMSFQPGEIAKIALTIFFAGYLVQTRDVLSLAGRKVLGFTFPRGRDLGPIMVAWAVSIAVLVFEKDLGSSLLFFGLFVAMLYVATERMSWIAIGMTLFAASAWVAFNLFTHLQRRVTLWLDPFSPESLEQSDQLAKGLMGMAAGGLFGTGLGAGRPWLVAFAQSDFIIPSLGEELGMTGLFAVLVLYGLFVQRGLRTALGVRDGFGKLLALGLAFSVALQVFVVIGGVTRVIPLTGLTTPFMSLGGSALLANWSILALLLRISDQARRPVPDSDGLAEVTARRKAGTPYAAPAPDGPGQPSARKTGAVPATDGGAGQ
ncbi:MAG: FtsW/RodA/SpoVE family cell cycle protein [Candidatus Phosphoribacter sp.]